LSSSGRVFFDSDDDRSPAMELTLTDTPSSHMWSSPLMEDALLQRATKVAWHHLELLIVKGLKSIA
jgi:hypothetical protein